MDYMLEIASSCVKKGHANLQTDKTLRFQPPGCLPDEGRQNGVFVRILMIFGVNFEPHCAKLVYDQTGYKRTKMT